MRSSLRLGQALALSGALAVLPRVTSAAEIVARGPRGCPDTAELEFRVERRINRPLGQAAPLHFDVTLEQTASDHRARIEVTPGGSRRELSAPDCDELADAVSIAIALALGNAAPGSLAVTGAEEGFIVAPPQPEALDLAATPTSRTAAAGAGGDSAPQGPPERADTSPDVSMTASVLVDGGSLPAPALGAGVGAAAAWRRWELHVLATLLFEQEAKVESATLAAPGARLGLWTASALGCSLPWSAGALRASACLGLEVGRLSGEGTGVSAPRRGGALWLAPQVQLGAAWVIPGSAFRLQAALLGAAPINRDEFSLRGIGAVHQPNPWIVRLSAGIGIEL